MIDVDQCSSGGTHFAARARGASYPLNLSLGCESYQVYCYEYEYYCKFSRFLLFVIRLSVTTDVFGQPDSTPVY